MRPVKPTDPRDQLAHRLARLFRWQRARSFTLALIGFATVTTVLARHQRSQPVVEELRAQGLLVDQALEAERTRTRASSAVLCIRRRYRECHPLAAGIINSGDHFIAHDLFGTSKIEIEIDADPKGAETKLRAWVRSICDSQARQLYLSGFSSPTGSSDVARMAKSECPSLETVNFYRGAIPNL